MKDSGVEWIGEIPEDWEVVKYKKFARSGMGQTILKEDTTQDRKEGLLPILSATQDETIFGYTSNNSLLLEKGDLVLPARGNSIGNVTFVSVPSTCTQTTIWSKLQNINNRFVYYCSYGLSDYWFKYDRTAIPQITVRQVQDNLIPVPKNSEQQKITNLLNEKTQMIDEIIADTKQSITELKAYKQSLITEAVTKGLDPNVEMKDSGVEWIGEVPEEWSRAKVKQLVVSKITDGPHTTPELQDKGIPFVSAEAVKNGIIDLNYKRGYISKEDHEKFSEKVMPKMDDIFMVKSGATTGNIGIVRTEEVFDVWSPLALIRVKKELISVKFMYYYLQSNLFRKQVELNWSFGTQQNIGMGVIEQLLVWFPNLNEQNTIMAWLEEKCIKVDDLIKSKEQLIADYKSYKKSLIYEYVTGKKQVI